MQRCPGRLWGQGLSRCAQKRDRTTGVPAADPTPKLRAGGDRGSSGARGRRWNPVADPRLDRKEARDPPWPVPINPSSLSPHATAEYSPFLGFLRIPESFPRLQDQRRSQRDRGCDRSTRDHQPQATPSAGSRRTQLRRPRPCGTYPHPPAPPAPLIGQFPRPRPLMPE